MSQSTTEIRIVPTPTGQDVLTGLLRDGARRMLAQAVEAEVAAWIADRAHLQDESGRRQVVRNGHLPERTIQTGLADLEIKQPQRIVESKREFGPGHTRAPTSIEAIMSSLH